MINPLSDLAELWSKTFNNEKKFTKKEQEKLYTSSLPNFVSMLPYAGYDKDTGTFILEDLVSRAISLTIEPISTEGKTGQQLAGMRDQIEDLYQELEEREEGRWVIQEFTYEDNSVDALISRMRAYVKPHAQGSMFTEQYLKLMHRHFTTLQKEEGLYVDTSVTNQPWRFKMPRTKLIIYRRQTPSEVRNFNAGKHCPSQEINEVLSDLKAKMNNARIHYKVDDDAALFTWLFKIFNPKPDVSVFENKDEYYSRMCDIDSELLTGRALCEALLSEQPESSEEDNAWYFNDRPTRFLRFSGLRKAPRIGALTGEVSSEDSASKSASCVLDALPSNSILAKTTVITPQPEFSSRFRKVRKSAGSKSDDAEKAKANFAQLDQLVASGKSKVSVSMGVYICGDNLTDLEAKQRKAIVVLNSAGLMLYKDKVDGLALKSFINHLPMNFRPEKDNGQYLRSMWTQHCANLFFAFSRGEGTGNPCLVFFNRGGSPIFFDPFNADDHEATGFGMIFGPTGSGKSVTIGQIVTSLAAMRLPRLFLIEYGDSFSMAAKDWAMKGLNVNYIKVMPDTLPKLAPFSTIDRVLEDLKDLDDASLDEKLDEFAEIDYVDINEKIQGVVKSEAIKEQADENSSSAGDTLGELELVLLLMATGSEESELNRFTRADRAMLRRSLVDTAKRQREKGLKLGLGKALPTVVTDIMETISGYVKNPDLSEKRKELLVDIVDALEMFTTGISATLFNTPSDGWEDADITVFNLGLLSQGGNVSLLNVAVLSLMQHINNLSEHYQFEARDVVSITDEAHLLLNNQVLGKILTMVTKTARKLGHTPFYATQDVDDLKGESAKILNNMEWYYCLNFRKKEADKVKELCNLSDEDVHLMTSTAKLKRCYTEGAIISPRNRIQFRSTPPSLILAQLQTDKDEKSARTKFMRENGITDELEAVYEIANQLDKGRGINGRLDYQEIKRQCEKVEAA